MSSRRKAWLERAEFIFRTVDQQSRINRSDLIRQWSYTQAYCALVFRKFLKEYPEAIVYDSVAKAYTPGPLFDHHLKTFTSERAI